MKIKDKFEQIKLAMAKKEIVTFRGIKCRINHLRLWHDNEFMYSAELVEVNNKNAIYIAKINEINVE